MCGGSFAQNKTHERRDGYFKVNNICIRRNQLNVCVVTNVGTSFTDLVLLKKKHVVFWLQNKNKAWTLHFAPFNIFYASNMSSFKIELFQISKMMIRGYGNSASLVNLSYQFIAINVRAWKPECQFNSTLGCHTRGRRWTSFKCSSVPTMPVHLQRVQCHAKLP